MNKRLLTSTVVETLGRNGALNMGDLYKQVKKIHGEAEEGVFEESVMLMELQGLVRVYKMPRGKMKVELTKG